MSALEAGLAPQLQQRIRQDVQSMHAYAIQDSAGMVKLDAMENPYELPAELRAAIGQRAGAAALNRYPDPSARGAQCLGAIAAELARGEGLTAHAKSAEYRMKQSG